MSSNPSLALLAPLLVTQFDAALKDVVDRIVIEAIRTAAQTAGCKTAAEQPVKQRRGHDPGPRDDPDRIVTLAEAAQLMGVSIDTLRRKHRDKFIQLSTRRYGMRRRDALLL